MENSKIFLAQEEHIPMAHKVETPDDISFKLNEAVRKIQIDTVKSDLIEDFASLGMTIEQLMVHFQVSSGSVESVKGTKAVTNGRFIKRAYKDIPGMGRKLVRDKLPSDGELPRTSKDEYLALLKKKLQEETKELIEANGQDNREEELADVSEVTEMLYEVFGLSAGEVKQKAGFVKTQQLRAIKRERRKLK